MSNNSKTNLTFPKYKQEISSNWKKLAQELSKKNEVNKIRKRKNWDKRTSSECKRHRKNGTDEKIWFEVDKNLLEETHKQQSPEADGSKNALTKPGNFNGLTKAVAMDCEMVGVGLDGSDSILARVSIVNMMGHCVYDKYVKPTEKVTDYRTHVSGIRPSDIEKGEEFSAVQKEVSEIISNRILVGHSIKNDFKVLFLSHPRHMIRDTSLYKPFRRAFGGKTPSLKKLSERFLAVKVQEGEHSSVQDAQAAMRLYTMHRSKWEAEMNNKRNWKPKSKRKKNQKTKRSEVNNNVN